MVILSSPSGAGKTTLVKLLSKNKKFYISISHTTRKPRPNEIADQDYYFVDQNKFEGLIKNEEFLEYAKVFKHFYGTTRTPVIKRLEKGENVIFDIDWQGADQIKNKEDVPVTEAFEFYMLKKFFNLELNAVTSKMLSFWENDFEKSIDKQLVKSALSWDFIKNKLPK